MSILCYHTVDADWGSGLAMSPDAFRAHARWLARHRHVVDLSTAVRLMDSRGRLPRKVVSLTFDDGLSGVYDHAFPVLRALGLPATVFVVARTLQGDRTVDWIDDPPSDHTLETLDPQQLRELSGAGIEIASHSHAHRVLPTLNPEECEDDLRLSRLLLEEEIGRPITHLAYPRGRHDTGVRAAARRAGYRHAFSLPESVEPVGAFALPRVGVYRHNGTRTVQVKSSRPYLGARLHPGSVPVRRVFRSVRAGGRPAEGRDVERVGEAVPTVRPLPGAAGTVAYVMSRFPKVSETFILNEIMAVERRDVAVHIQPLLRERVKILHPGAAALVARADYQPFISPSILASQLWFLRHRPRRYLTTIVEVLVGTAGSLNFTVGALGILPKVVHIARKLEGQGVGHVHCHFANHPALAGFVIHQLTGLPYSFTAHGSDLHVDRHMLPQKVAAAAFVVTVSDYNRRLIVEECGASAAEKVEVIRCGVDTKLFRPRPARSLPEAVRLVCVGTIHEVKGQHVLIEAVDLLRRRGMASSVAILGEGPDRARLERRVRALGLEASVRFLGEADRDGVLRALHAADVLVAPSVPTSGGKREGIPVVLMEGMACALPVITSRLSGIPELVEDEFTGLLLPPGDVSALADAIARLANDAGLRRRLGAAARERVVDAFDLDRNAHQLVDRFGVPSRTDDHGRPAAAATAG